MPQEETLELQKSKRNLSIGIPREITAQENRIALVPNAVSQLIQQGHELFIESEAGADAHFTDVEYSEAGGRIVYTAEEVYQADIILKVAPLSLHEINYLKSRQTIISSLQLTSQNKEYFKKLIEKKATALAFEYIKDKSGSFPILQSMSEIVGRACIFIAEEYLSDKKYGKGKMFGGFPGVTPTDVVIIGAGTVGLNAAKAAISNGASVKVFDDNIYKLRKLQTEINSSVYTSIMQPGVLLKALRSADVVIGALYSREGITDYVVTEDMVRQMKPGTVIIDVSIDQGGCVETSDLTTHRNPVITKYDITHYGVPNIASKYAHTASYALSNFFTPVIKKIGEEGGVRNLLRSDYGICQGAYLFNGILTSKHISELYDLPFQNIDLLMAAFE